MIQHHHERWDGDGYPIGLAGEEIPLGARIIALAEAFDAMTLPPEWKRALTPEEALDELESEAGKQFDPNVFEAFRRVQPKIQPIGL